MRWNYATRSGTTFIPFVTVTAVNGKGRITCEWPREHLAVGRTLEINDSNANVGDVGRLEYYRGHGYGLWEFIREEIE